MRVIICGSRILRDYNFVKKICFEIILKEQYTRVFPNKEIEILSGKNPNGGDKLGEDFAKEFGLKVKPFEPRWKELTETPSFIKSNQYGQYNSLAGMNRNTRMVEYASEKENSICIAFDMGTDGTKDTIKKSKKAGIKTFQIKCKDIEKHKVKVWNDK